MSMAMDDSIKRWMEMRKTALLAQIIQGKTTMAVAVLKLRIRNKLPSRVGWQDGRCVDVPLWPSGGWDSGAACQALRLVRLAAADGLLQADQGRAAGRYPLCRADQGDDRKGAFVRLSHHCFASGHK